MDLQHTIDRLIDQALAEDLGHGDVTSLACIPSDVSVDGRFLLKQSGVIAAIPFVQKLFQHIDSDIVFSPVVSEGSYLRTGVLVATIQGPLRAIMSGERVALNLLQHASGVATLTAEHVRKVKGTGCIILDTRKTLPGLRALEKYAVTVGGGFNHRFGLYDRFIIKPNHLAFIAQSSRQPIKEAVRRIRECNDTAAVEIEIGEVAQLHEALDTDVSAIMLYGMMAEEVKECVKLAKPRGKKVYFESAISFAFDSILEYARAGIDGISISALTYSAAPLDIGLKLNVDHQEMLHKCYLPQSLGRQIKSKLFY